MVLRMPVASEVSVLVAGFESLIGSQLLDDREDCLVIGDLKGATSAEIVLRVDHDQS